MKTAVAARVLVRGVSAAYFVAVLVALPYLFFAISHGLPRLPASWPFVYTGDAANLVLPTRLIRFGGDLFGPLSDRFQAPVDESAAYLGSLLAIIVLFALKRPLVTLHRVLVWSLCAIGVASLGPALTIAGTRIIGLPWTILAVVPIIKLALPARFAMYAWLLVSVITALWLCSPGKRTSMKWVLVVVSALLLLPNTSVPFWHSTPPVPRFFSSGVYREYLKPTQNTLIIPYGGVSFSMLWQAKSEMWFSMPEGRLCPMPQNFQTWPIVRTFRGGPLTSAPQQDLEEFLAAKHVEKIVLVEGTPGPWLALFGSLGDKPRRVADVLVYDVPATILTTRLDATQRPVVKELRGQCG